jgi:transposase
MPTGSSVYRLPGYAPELDPTEGVWANLKNGLGNLAARSVDDLARIVRTGLKRMQYHPDLINGFLAETGLVPPPT